VTSFLSLPELGARDLASAVSGDARDRFEAALGSFLHRQRWFASKASTIAAVRVHDSGVLDGCDDVAIALVDVELADRRTERYSLPVAHVGGEAADECLRTHPQAAIGWLDGPRRSLLADAMSLDPGCRQLGIVLAMARASTLASGAIQITRDAAEGRLEALRSARVVRTGAEQSNSSVIFAGAAILKIYRRLEAGPHPELEMGRYLRARGFNDVPAVLASIEYVDETERYALAVLHELVPDAADGWKHALAAIGAYFERIDGMPPPDATALRGEPAVTPGKLSTEAARLVGPYLDAARTLGTQTGRLHLALSEGTDSAFAPEPLTADDIARTVDGTRRRATRAFSRLASSRASVPKAAAARVDRLLEQQSSLFARLDVDIDPAGATRTRCHQDYHLGQLLWTDGDRYALLDFEGEPARPLAERRAKRSPLTDVAGMLRSYSYAAWSGLFARAQEMNREPMADRPWAAMWEHAVSGAFLQRYLETTDGASFLPRHSDARAGLLRLLMLDKALYELEYELNNRPDWILVPVEGLLELI
jgi:trehalose synthase-fused probable maltokinase